ncbi:ABC transporter ATP-binding protein, partial [Bacillus thuringiensis]|nr:ABC transporter ATP-binding protein [Bacillus thuringiensis]
HDPAIASNSDRIITITDGMIISDKQLVQNQEKCGGEEY